MYWEINRYPDHIGIRGGSRISGTGVQLQKASAEGATKLRLSCPPEKFENSSANSNTSMRFPVTWE
jgi:hypothetical protein